MNREILKLFKGYYADDEIDSVVSYDEEALKYGIIISDNIDKEIVSEAIRLYGKDGKKWNQCFHKSFSTVANSSIEDLVFQQVVHYFTTYGFESLGIYDSDIVYLPKEKLEIPELEKDIEMVVIKPLTSINITKKIMTLLTSGIALSEDTIDSIMVLSDFIPKNDIDSIKNREVKIALYDKYDLVPNNPDEFLRYLIYKTTGLTLKIQNREAIQRIKTCDKAKALMLLNKYTSMENLSSIFLRNKDLFLAYKVSKDDTRYAWTNQNIRIELNKKLNKLRKLANKHHRPLQKNIVDNVTDVRFPIDLVTLPSILDNITIFREIRILNSLNYRLTNNENIVFKVRNGKTYVSKTKLKEEDEINILYNRREVIYSHLIERIRGKVEGKIICIPKNVTYAAPTSEKQFNDNFPYGTCIEIPRTENLIYGVHWENIITERRMSERVDLDLKQMNNNVIFGWDYDYKDQNNNILFSGDVTDAPSPNGATELFYINKNYGYGAFLLTLNMYTSNSQDVPFELVIAKGETIEKNYCINPNNILTNIHMTVKNTERQKVVGTVVIGETLKFYFNDFSAGKSCSTSFINDITKGMYNYLINYNKCQVKLNDLLKEAGAVIISKPTLTKTTVIDNGIIKKEAILADIDLSIESITKETIIDLLS